MKDTDKVLTNFEIKDGFYLYYASFSCEGLWLIFKMNNKNLFNIYLNDELLLQEMSLEFSQLHFKIDTFGLIISNNKTNTYSFIYKDKHIKRKLSCLNSWKLISFKRYDNKLFAVGFDKKNITKGLSLIFIDIDSNKLNVLDSKHSFYHSFDVSSDNIAYCVWDLNTVPWEQSTLITAKITAKGLRDKKIIDNALYPMYGFKDNFYCQNNLFYLRKRKNFWQIFNAIDNVFCEQFFLPGDNGLTVYPCFKNLAKIYGDLIFFKRIYKGAQGIVCVNLCSGKKLYELSEIVKITNFSLYENKLLICGSSKTSRNFMAIYKADEGKILRALSSVFNDKFIDSNCSLMDRNSINKKCNFINNKKIIAKHISFLSQGKKVYGFLYFQKNTPKKTYFPLIIKVHGGPFGYADPAYSPYIQFWLNQGFAYFDLNYVGSDSYGYDYMSNLYNSFGYKEVQNILDCREYLLNNYPILSDKVILSGGSSGGFSALHAASLNEKLFQALFLVAPLVDLTPPFKGENKLDMEKAFGRYLIGEYKTHRNKYFELSPINHIHKLKNIPMFVAHTTDDPVINKHDVDLFVKKLSKFNSKIHYVVYEENNHMIRDDKHLFDLDIRRLNFTHKYIIT